MYMSFAALVTRDVSGLGYMLDLEHRPYTLYEAYGRTLRPVRSAHTRRTEATIRTVQTIRTVLCVWRTMPTLVISGPTE
jgi:hypothetical protein